MPPNSEVRLRSHRHSDISSFLISSCSACCRTTPPWILVLSSFVVCSLVHSLVLELWFCFLSLWNCWAHPRLPTPSGPACCAWWRWWWWCSYMAPAIFKKNLFILTFLALSENWFLLSLPSCLVIFKSKKKPLAVALKGSCHSLSLLQPGSEEKHPS